MTTRVIFGQERLDESDEQQNEQFDVRNVDWQPTCPECNSQVITEDVETVCAECGLVVTVDALERKPGLKAHAPTNSDRMGEWAVETTNTLRVDKGLHTTFFLTTDGKGNELSPAMKDKMARLRRRHKRFTMSSDRDKRMNEGFRDIGMLGANLALPEYIQTDASNFLKAAKEARLPGGRMAWESLAAGAVMLAVRRANLRLSPADIARYAKTSKERICAAARKIRLQTPVELPPVRDHAVDRVIASLEDVGLSVSTGIKLIRIADQLIEMADSKLIGPGTARMTVAGAAVYAADRLTDGKAVTQAEVVDAVETVVSTSKSKIASYSQTLHDEAARHLHQVDTTARLVIAD